MAGQLGLGELVAARLQRTRRRCGAAVRPSAPWASRGGAGATACRSTAARRARRAAGDDRGAARAGHAASGEELHDKFVQSGSAFTLSFGSLSSFYLGLEGMIGTLPTSSTGSKEHCESEDSRDEFAAGNYGTTTSSQVEWWFVVEPEHGLRRWSRPTGPTRASCAPPPERCRQPTPSRVGL